jgi:hypothetical protein
LSVGCSSDGKDDTSGGDVALVANCGPGALTPCSSYLTPTADGAGDLTTFGSYGAVMDINVGTGFEIEPEANDTDPDFCNNFAKGFGEDPSLTEQVLDLRDTDLRLYTVFRPANWVDGEKYPVLTWGNGTCAQPGSYAALLMHAASYGFVVVAANGRFVANGAQLTALDYAAHANEDPASPYFGRLDLTKVGAWGHSQGGGATVAAAKDDRVLNAIVFNGGPTASKPFLAVSSDRDIGNPTPESYRAATEAAPKGSFVFFHKVPETGGSLTGHLTLMMQPSRVVDAATGFWRLVFKNDAKAKALYIGSTCGLCGKDDDFEFGEHGFD